MNILVSCEMSGRVREAFRKKGHNAYSCDLLPSLDNSPYHFVGDVIPHINDAMWDMLIAFVPCTYLCVSGQHWNDRVEGRWDLVEAAVAFFMAHANARAPKIVIENPVGIMSSRWRKPDQIIQPHDFGDDASKKTCLWLKGVPKLRIDPAKRFPGRIVEWPRGSGKMVERWSNQTDSNQNRLGPSEDRAMLRSLTYPGIADAFAENWG